MENKHYICTLGCRGVSDKIGVCQAINCKGYQHLLVECSCKDGQHYDVKTQRKNKIWFKRKLYGYGWYPSSLEGWLIVLFYILALIFISIRITNESSFLLEFNLPVIVLTLVLIFISYKKGEKPRWQWGKDLGDRKNNS